VYCFEDFSKKLDLNQETSFYYNWTDISRKTQLFKQEEEEEFKNLNRNSQQTICLWFIAVKRRPLYYLVYFVFDPKRAML
jgi:hypothetical protein